MDNEMLIVIAVVAVAVLVVAALWVAMRKRRTSALRARFGPEYDRVLKTSRTPAEAEHELKQRESRVKSFAVRPLSREDADRFGDSWRAVQAQFVDDPRAAVLEGDRLIVEVMRARGYPVDNDPDRRLDDLSVDHAHVVNHYRAGREIAARHERGQASTEDLRQAMVHFRALFEELVATDRPTARRAS